MKTTKHTLPASIALTLCMALPSSVTAQAVSTSIRNTRDAMQETSGAKKPETFPEKLGNIKKRHAERIAEPSRRLRELYGDPGMVGSNEFFGEMDKIERQMELTRSRCHALLESLRADSSNIRAQESFGEEQKAELLASSDALYQDCEALLHEVSLGIDHAPPERLAGIKLRHGQAFNEISAWFRLLSSEPELMDSKDLSEAIDTASREMKRTLARCASFKAALNADARNIRAASWLADERKQELLTASETLAKDCEALSGEATLKAGRLNDAFRAVARWKKTYKAYLKLQGEEKASAQVKTLVDEYLKSFTPQPEFQTGAETGAEPQDQPPATE